MRTVLVSQWHIHGHIFLCISFLSFASLYLTAGNTNAKCFRLFPINSLACCRTRCTCTLTAHGYAIGVPNNPRMSVLIGCIADNNHSKVAKRNIIINLRKKKTKYEFSSFITTKTSNQNNKNDRWKMRKRKSWRNGTKLIVNERAQKQGGKIDAERERERVQAK